MPRPSAPVTARELERALLVAAQLAAEGRASGLAFFERIESELAQLQKQDDALARAKRLVERDQRSNAHF